MKLGYCLPSFTLKHRAEQGLFWGYASTHTIDHVQDQILPGAFTQTLHHWKSHKGRFPHIYWEHDPEEVIGWCKELREDGVGLHIEGKLLMDLPKAQEAYALLPTGRNGLSIGFYALDVEKKQDIRQIRKVALHEVSLVQKPCNVQARIHGYKSASTFPSQESILCCLSRLKKNLTQL